jgi:hypothetical protein
MLSPQPLQNFQPDFNREEHSPQVNFAMGLIEPLLKRLGKVFH